MSRDTIVVAGLGAVGSATALHLAAAGHRVIGLDRFRPPHDRGSTHGESRVTRVTAWEGTQYVPLVHRANLLWDVLARASGEDLGARTGGLFVGFTEEYHVAGSLDCANAAQLPHELVDRDEITRRWPGLVVPEGMVGFVDPGAGVLYPERIVAAMLRLAAAHGADLRYDEPMLDFAADGEGVSVKTSAGVLRVDRLVLCGGPWMGVALRRYGIALQVERVSMHWFDASAHAVQVRGDLPVLLLSDGRGHATAVFPTLGGRIKAAGHGTGDFADAPKSIGRASRPEDIAPVEPLLRRFLPTLVGAHRESGTCLYTRTPTGHFILDRAPGHPQIVIGSACNGFGFKFASATGEILAALAVDKRPAVDHEPWTIRP